MLIGATSHDTRGLTRVAEATRDDLRADMTYHRATYRRFVRFFFFSSVGAAIVLGALFLLIYR